MGTKRFGRSWILVVSAGLLAGGAALGACGSDSFTPGPSTDGGNDDGSTTVDSGGPTGDAGAGGDSAVSTDCIKPPTSQPGNVAFCAAFAAISSRCGQCEPCRLQNANNCDKLGSGLSDAFKNGIAACQDQIDCDEFSNQAAMATNPCVLARIADAGLTEHQKLTQLAYCQNCSPDGGGPYFDNCVHYFSDADGGAGIGAGVIVESDDVADKTATG